MFLPPQKGFACEDSTYSTYSLRHQVSREASVFEFLIAMTTDYYLHQADGNGNWELEEWE